jgi:uncharacterized protein YjbI with pentapeptide repeats
MLLETWSDADKMDRLRRGEPLLFPPRGINEGPAENAARTVRAEWLDGNQPVVLAHAVVAGPVRLSAAPLDHSWSVTQTVFRDAVDLSSAVLARTVCFDGSHFLGPVRLHDARVLGSFECRGAFFGRPADFSEMAIGQSLDARGATFAEATFDGMRVEGDALFESYPPGSPAYFTGPASFARTKIGKMAVFASAQFLESATFDGCEIEQSLIFSPHGQTGLQVQFRGPASFVGAVLRQDGDFRGAVFRADAAFDQMRVSGRAHFGPDDAGRRAAFLRGVQFNGAVVEGQASFQDADFFGQAQFRNVSFNGGANFDRVGFRHPADFMGACTGKRASA